MVRNTCLTACLFFCCLVLFAQQSKDTLAVIDLNEKAFKLYGVDAYQMESEGQKALELSLTLDYQEGAAMSFNTIALANLSRANYKEAAENFIEALKIYDALADEQSAANILSNMGVVYYYLDDHERSLEYHQRALAERMSIGDSQQIAKSFNNLGISHKNLGNVEKALSYYLQSLEYKSMLGDSAGMSSTLNNIGNVHLAQKRYEEALEYFTQSLNLDSASGSTLGIATSLANIGEVYAKTGEYKKAEEYLVGSIELAEFANAPQTRVIGYKNLSDLYQSKNEYQTAIIWLNRWVALRDSLTNTEKSRAINEVETKYKTDRIKNENTLLKQKQQLQEAQISRQRTLIFAGVSITILVLILGIIGYRGYRLKRRNLKIEEQKTAEVSLKNEQISLQKKQLEEINEAKNRMFSILSHDLKAPVARLQSVLELAQLDMLSEEELKPMLKKMAKETNDVGELLTNVLEWVKTQMGGLAMSKQDIKLGTVSEEVINIYAPFAYGKGLKVENTIDEALEVRADANMLRLIFRNLLANAIKFTSAGTVSIASTVNKGMAVVSVKDTGIGLSNDDIEKIFTPQPFTKEGTANEKGSGLGLLLVKEFVLKSGGTISVESQLGKGSTFEFTIPLS